MTVAVTARMLQAEDYFVRFGLIPEGAATIVGNGCQESGPNLDSTFERPNSNEGSGGFLEWRDSPGSPRKTRLASFADARGPGLKNDLDTQCDYCMWELQKYFPSLDQQLRNPGRTIKNLTANFCWVYENPAPATAGMDNRIAHAEAVAARAAEIRSSQVPQPVPPAPVPQVPVPPLPPVIPPVPAVPAGLPPMSSTSAGRIAALTDAIIEARAARVAELVAGDTEIAGYDESLAAFGKVIPVILPMPPVLSLPPPTSSTTPAKGNTTMNAQIQATIRSILLAFGGALVSKGVIDQSTLVSIVGGAVSALSYGWSMWAHTTTGTIAAAAALPMVSKIVVPAEISDGPAFANNSTVVSH